MYSVHVFMGNNYFSFIINIMHAATASSECVWLRQFFRESYAKNFNNNKNNDKNTPRMQWTTTRASKMIYRTSNKSHLAMCDFSSK